MTGNARFSTQWAINTTDTTNRRETLIIKIKSSLYLFFVIFLFVKERFSKIEKTRFFSIMCVNIRKLFFLITILIYLEKMFVHSAHSADKAVIDKGITSV